ncbi:uncharacterized protein [Bemisia tabaci]|uniref:uncharacterized protein isoform X3 n=1 Tax=Bemisia tabaci TaxID=7038 RepID=UPI003B284774
MCDKAKHVPTAEVKGFVRTIRSSSDDQAKYATPSCCTLPKLHGKNRSQHEKKGTDSTMSDWEVVGGKHKKEKPSNKKNAKKETQKFLDKAPKIEDIHGETYLSK